MANEVYANGMELACKAGAGKTICSFPDVCFTPPENPATPPGVPIPYPNTGFASDTTEGSKTVKISDKEVMLKNKSYFKKSTGDEAGAAAKKGVISSKNTGKVYFIKWSMDVKFEGENVDRHLDMTTNNHGSPIANEGIPWPFIDALKMANRIDECADAVSSAHRECTPWNEKAKCPEEHEARIDDALANRDKITAGLKASGLSKHKIPKNPNYIKANRAVNDQYMAYTGELSKNKCRKAMRCILMPYKDMNKVKCRHQTPEHLIEQSSVDGVGNYKLENAPCAFTEGTSWHLGDHGVMSTGRLDAHSTWAKNNPGATYDMATAASIGAEVHQESNKASGCDPKCTEKQLIQGHNNMGVNENDALKPTQTGIADSHEAARRQEILKLQQEQLMDLGGRK